MSKRLTQNVFNIVIEGPSLIYHCLQTGMIVIGPLEICSLGALSDWTFEKFFGSEIERLEIQKFKCQGTGVGGGVLRVVDIKN